MCKRAGKRARDSHVHRIEVAVPCQQSDYFGRKSVTYVLNPLQYPLVLTLHLNSSPGRPRLVQHREACHVTPV